MQGTDDSGPRCTYLDVSSGALPELRELTSALLMSVTGGGLHRSYRGSSEAASVCRSLAGAIVQTVVAELCASKISTGFSAIE